MSAPFNPRVVRLAAEPRAPSRQKPSCDDTSPSSFEPSEALEDVDEFEDTQPSIVLPDADDEWADAPTIPGFRLRTDGGLERFGGQYESAHDGQWERVLRAVAFAVKRVFASHYLE